MTKKYQINLNKFFTKQKIKKMKAIISIPKSVLGIFLVLGLLIFSAQSANAQPKPKGEPWPAPAAEIAKKNPVKSDPLSIKDGKALWIKNCQSCHGDNGKGDGTKAGNLKISCGDFTLAEFKKVTDGELFWKITEGRKPMPTFEKKLSDNERWSVINYMRTFAK
jgi:mono/diheme cytochrome c family protein